MEVYYVGNLARDRANDPEVEKIAEDFLERGTPIGRPIRPHLGDDSPRGRGEGTLSQKKLWDGVYEYRFHPRGQS